MRAVPTVAVAFVLSVSSAAAQAVAMQLGGEYFRWQEFFLEERLLEETGPRFFLELQGDRTLSSTWILRASGRVYGGEVSYDGQTDSDQPLPVGTDVGYFGLRGEVNLLGLGGGRWLGPLLGVGVDWWQRDLQDSTTYDGAIPVRVSGYLEEYTIAYGRLGVASRGESLRLSAGAKYPFFTDERVLGLTLRPKGRLSYFFSAEYGQKRGVGIYYDSYRFDQSDPDGGYVQPESHQDTVGIYAHFQF